MQARTRFEPFRQNTVLYLVRELDHAVNLRLCLLALPHELLELFVHDVLALEELVDEVLLDRESRLHRLLAGPVFAMSLPLDKDLDPQRSASKASDDLTKLDAPSSAPCPRTTAVE